MAGVPNGLRPTRYIQDGSDIADWPATIALVSTDMLQSYLPNLGLEQYSGLDVQQRSREFVQQWKALDGTKPDFVESLDRLIGNFLDDIHRDGRTLERIVHEAHRFGNEFGKLAQWMAALCTRDQAVGGDRPPISGDDVQVLWNAVQTWCLEAKRADMTLSKLEAMQPATEWDVWLCKEGFYGDDEFLATVMAQRIVAWRTVESLRERFRSVLPERDLPRVVEWARSRVPVEGKSEYFHLEL